MADRQILVPGRLALPVIESWVDAPSMGLELDPNCLDRVTGAAALVARAAAGEAAVYGVNTGFGKLARVRIAAADIAELQRRLVLSHMCGVGAPLDAGRPAGAAAQGGKPGSRALGRAAGHHRRAAPSP